ncbi:uncharacterized protein LOC118749545 [Rhagoletis pomonella]|uniref:uncharacterized protein LOC118749545 n=1 Tax=Rhagoletis pomonella TaxID=28610 RepID=UPI00177BCF0B|nr:uncharacterized protein LOC118749545 [Rhagoletis pomonella]
MKHMELAPESSNQMFYMPHHPVVKESSLTTKLRVVFNASAKSATGNSLNDALFVGPQLQQDSFSILTRFRTHRYAVTADIAKMYRQVCVSPKHVDLQRIVWRRDPSLPMQDYRMLRVTYGVAAASHLAVKSLQQTAKCSSNVSEKAASVILNDFYMDDLLTGTASKAELLLLQRNISGILQQGGFELRKWASNCAEFSEYISNASKTISHYLVEGKDVHALGLMWNTEDDFLTFTVNMTKPPAALTKRTFLSDASTLFDPLGLLAPATIRSKMWFQEIWRHNVGWDDLIPDSLATKWLVHRSELKLLSNLKICRWLGLGTTRSLTELHIFADASERAYAAVMYARTVQIDGSATVALISSKTKVAPLKTTTLPRLELCAAHLAAKLARSVLHSLGDLRYPLYAWTDSTITLAWLQAHPSRWITFVANRVADVQETLPPECWNHVRSELNPADCASRGITPSELLRQQLWWTGPEFLKGPDQFWKQTSPKHHTTDLGVRSKVSAHITTSNEHWSILTRFSAYSKLRRIIAYVLRFFVNARASTRLNAAKLFGPPSCKEIAESELHLISAKRPIPLRSSLLRLQPYLDEKGVLRVGGRLKNAEVTPDVKHPIVLPKNSPLAKLIIREIHEFTLHAGPRIMQTVLQRRYWVIGARSLIRSIYHKCVKCTLLNRNLTTQSMGDLPAARTTKLELINFEVVNKIANLDELLLRLQHQAGNPNIKEIEWQKNYSFFEQFSITDLQISGNKVLKSLQIILTDPVETITEDDKKLKLMTIYHNDPISGGHCGNKKLYAKLRTKYYWKNMTRDIAKFVKSCEKCLLNKVKPKTKENLVLTPTPCEPFDVAVIDTIGPLPESINGNRFAVTIICDLSKYLVTIATPDKSAKTVASAIFESFVLTYGIMNTIKSDLGTEF